MEIEKKIETFVNNALMSQGKSAVKEADEPLISTGKLDSLFVIDFILFLEDEFKLDFSKENVSTMDIDNLSSMVSLVQKKLSSQ